MSIAAAMATSGLSQPDDGGVLLVQSLERNDNQTSVLDDHKDEDDRVEHRTAVPFNPATERKDKWEKLLTTLETAVDLCKRNRGDPQYRNNIVQQIKNYIATGSMDWGRSVSFEDKATIMQFVGECTSYYQHVSTKFEKIRKVLQVFVNKVECLGYECVRVGVDISDDALSYLLSSINYVTQQLRLCLLPSENELWDEMDELFKDEHSKNRQYKHYWPTEVEKNKLFKSEDRIYTKCLLDMFSTVVKHIRIQITISQIDMLNLLKINKINGGKLKLVVMAKLNKKEPKSNTEEKTQEEEEKAKKDFVSAFNDYRHVQRALNHLFFPEPHQTRSEGEADGGITQAEPSGAATPLIQSYEVVQSEDVLANVADPRQEGYGNPVDHETLADNAESVADPRQEVGFDRQIDINTRSVAEPMQAEFKRPIDQLADVLMTGNADGLEHLLKEHLGRVNLATDRDSTFQEKLLYFAKTKDVAQMLVDSVHPPEREKFILSKDRNRKTTLENADDDGRKSLAEYLRKLPPIINSIVAQEEETPTYVDEVYI